MCYLSMLEAVEDRFCLPEVIYCALLCVLVALFGRDFADMAAVWGDIEVWRPGRSSKGWRRGDLEGRCRCGNLAIEIWRST